MRFVWSHDIFLMVKRLRFITNSYQCWGHDTDQPRWWLQKVSCPGLGQLQRRRRGQLGALYYQPKQCTFIRGIPQNYLPFKRLHCLVPRKNDSHWMTPGQLGIKLLAQITKRWTKQGFVLCLTFPKTMKIIRTCVGYCQLLIATSSRTRNNCWKWGTLRQ